MITNHVRRLVSVRTLLMAALAMFCAASFGVFHPQQVVLAQAAPDTYKDVYDGWKWWHVYCYRCHGVNGVGATNAPNLIDPNRRLSQAAFLKIVRDGIPDKGMQAWDKLLDTKQIGQIHTYVLARTDNVLPPGRPDEVGPNGGAWVPPRGWPKR